MQTLNKRQAWNDFFVQTNFGQAIISAENSHLEAFLENFVGYDFLQITPSDTNILFDAPRVKNTYFIADKLKFALNKSSVICSPCALPFANQSIDLVFLHHFLEWQDNPANILKEAARVVHPKGYLLLAIFRPFSPLRFNKLFKQTSDRDLTKNKILNWIEFLDLEVVNHKRIFTALPVENENIIKVFTKLNEKYLDKFGINFFGNIDLIWLQKRIGCANIQVKQKPLQILNKNLGLSNVKTSSQWRQNKNKL